MLDPRFIESNLDLVQNSISSRGTEINFELFKRLDSERKKIIKEVEELEFKRNQGSKRIGELKKNDDSNELDNLLSDLKKLSDSIKSLNDKRAKVESDFRDYLLEIPNIPHSSVPIGKDENDNLEIRRWGQVKEFDFEIKDHVAIGSKLDILDLPRASKITGSRFSLYKGLGARLERALINFMLDTHTKEHGYTEVLPPFIANSDSFIGTGNLPKFEGDLFKLNETDYYLIPTAEVPVTNIHRDEILDFESLPIKYVAYTPCFRKEAGSYGKDVQGIMRQHQFNKVELVKFSKPEDSYNELETLTKDASTILELLKLPYRVVALCTGDLSFSSAKTYDLEVWVPSEEKYREISSCSNFESFQARRANIRSKGNKNKRTSHIHTLNGSGLAVGRTVIAILENYQQKDGTVKIPDVLINYLDGIEYID